MGKYDSLGAFLEKQGSAEVGMTFEEIERVLRSKLPSSALEHRAWWANEARGHVHAKAWIDAGYQTAQVDMAAKKLLFRRIIRDKSFASLEAQQALKPLRSPAEQKPRRSPLFGALKGTFTIEPGYDLTQPAMPEWAASLEEQLGPDLPR